MSDATLVLGGSGFVGRHLVGRLVAAGRRVIVPTRQRERAKHLILLPTVDVVEADVHSEVVLARLTQRASVVVNLVGILHEPRRGGFDRVHVELARKLVFACRAAGVSRLLHMSALNADTKAPSRYLRSKGEAEAIVAASELAWTIFRPSVIFGREDSFLNLFATLEKFSPFIPLACAGAKFQPVYVGDVARAFEAAAADDSALLQRFVSPVALQEMMCRKPDGGPASLIGATVFRLVETASDLGDANESASIHAVFLRRVFGGHRRAGA